MVNYSQNIPHQLREPPLSIEDFEAKCHSRQVEKKEYFKSVVEELLQLPSYNLPYEIFNYDLSDHSIVTTSDDKSIKKWSLYPFKLLWTYHPRPELYFGNYNEYSEIEYQHHNIGFLKVVGKVVVATAHTFHNCERYSTLKFINFEDGKEIATVTSKQSEFEYVRLLDQSVILYFTNPPSIKSFNTQTGKLEGTVNKVMRPTCLDVVGNEIFVRIIKNQNPMSLKWGDRIVHFEAYEEHTDYYPKHTLTIELGGKNSYLHITDRESNKMVFSLEQKISRINQQVQIRTYCRFYQKDEVKEVLSKEAFFPYLLFVKLFSEEGYLLFNDGFQQSKFYYFNYETNDLKLLGTHSSNIYELGQAGNILFSVSQNQIKLFCRKTFEQLDEISVSWPRDIRFIEGKLCYIQSNKVIIRDYLIPNINSRPKIRKNSPYLGAT